MNSSDFSARMFARVSMVLLLLCTATVSVAGEASLAVEASARAWTAAWADEQGLASPRIELTVLPPRMAAPQCGSGLRIEPIFTEQLTRLRFHAVCAGAKPVVYVVRANVYAPAVAVKQNVAANAVLEDGDLKTTEHDYARAPDALRDRAHVVGRHAVHALRAGQVLRQADLQQGISIKRGEPVQIVAQLNGAQIRGHGVAMQPARQGDVLRVRNSASGKQVMVRLREDGQVEPLLTPAP